MRAVNISVAVLLVLSTVAVGTASAEPEWEPYDCDDAPTISPGTHSVSVGNDNGPVFTLDTSAGDRINFRVEELTGSVEWARIGEIFKRNFDTDSWNEFPSQSDVLAGHASGPDLNVDPGENAGESWGDTLNMPEGGSGAIVPTTNDDPCLVIWGWEETGGVVFSFDINDPAPDVLTASEAEEILDENAELQNQIDELESENAELQNQIDELESENAELQNQINELETELENAEVSIEVSVEPEGQANFQVGGEMAVSISSDDVAASDITVRFGGEQYTPSGGEATIPLESTGTQQLNIEYQDMTETVTLDVADQDEDTATDDASTTDDNGSTDESADDDGTGFGIVAALVALIGIGLLSHRQFTSKSE
jgi:PGF-CTERM protein